MVIAVLGSEHSDRNFWQILSLVSFGCRTLYATLVKKVSQSKASAEIAGV